MSGRALATVAVLAAALQTPAVPSPIWRTDIPQTIVAIAPAPNGRCVAAVTDAMVYMVDAGGRIIWQAALSDPADPSARTPIAAASPTCDWAAVTTHSGLVQLLSANAPRVVASFGDTATAIDQSTFWPRSLQIAPDGSMVVIGTERDWLVLVNRTGQVKTVQAGEFGQPVTAEFSADGKRVVVTGMWTAGVMTLDGAWVWHRKLDFFQISPSRDLSVFAAYFVPAHGPQAGALAILDAQGHSIWDMNTWDPAVAMAPDGSFIAYANIPGRDMPATDTPTTLVVADRSGRTLKQQTVPGYFRSITAGNCVLVQERETIDVGYDLVARDRTLKEIWRLPDLSRFLNSRGQIAGDLAVVAQRRTLAAYRLPSCRG